MISLFRQIQSTPYSNYDDELAVTWANVQKKCAVAYPTAVQSLQTNVTSRFGFAIPGAGYNYGCLTGKTYKVQAGENCETIAEKSSVSTGTLISINQLLPARPDACLSLPSNHSLSCQTVSAILGFLGTAVCLCGCF